MSMGRKQLWRRTEPGFENGAIQRRGVGVVPVWGEVVVELEQICAELECWHGDATRTAAQARDLAGDIIKLEVTVRAVQKEACDHEDGHAAAGGSKALVVTLRCNVDGCHTLSASNNERLDAIVSISRESFDTLK